MQSVHSTSDIGSFSVFVGDKFLCAEVCLIFSAVVKCYSLLKIVNANFKDREERGNLKWKKSTKGEKKCHVDILWVHRHYKKNKEK